MGWNSANEIFDPVAELVVSLNLPPGYTQEILEVLIHQLQLGDWDTEGESLELFKNNPEVVDAFHTRGITLPGKRCPHCDELLEEDDAG